MIDKLINWANDLLNRLKAFVGDVNSTNWVIFTGTCAGLVTCVVYLTGMMLQRHPEAVTFGIWCGTIAGWIGFGVRQFRHKRETFNDPTRESRGKSGEVPTGAAS